MAHGEMQPVSGAPEIFGDGRSKLLENVLLVSKRNFRADARVIEIDHRGVGFRCREFDERFRYGNRVVEDQQRCSLATNAQLLDDRGWMSSDAHDFQD